MYNILCIDIKYRSLNKTETTTTKTKHFNGPESIFGTCLNFCFLFQIRTILFQMSEFSTKWKFWFPASSSYKL